MYLTSNYKYKIIALDGFLFNTTAVTDNPMTAQIRVVIYDNNNKDVLLSAVIAVPSIPK